MFYDPLTCRICSRDLGNIRTTYHVTVRRASYVRSYQILPYRYKSGHSSSHRAPQKVSRVPIGSKSNSLSFGRVKTQFYQFLPYKHKNGHSSSHRAFQKVSRVPIDSKSNSLSFGSFETQFCQILPYKHKNGHSSSNRAFQKVSRVRTDRAPFHLLLSVANLWASFGCQPLRWRARASSATTCCLTKR